MNDRGQYGHAARIGADRSPQATPWWKIAIGASVVLGAGYLVTRPRFKKMERTVGKVHDLARAVGIKPGMSQAEQDRAWDAYYVKRRALNKQP